MLFGRDRLVERVVVHIHLGAEQEPFGHPELGDVEARVAGRTGVDGNNLKTPFHVPSRPVSMVPFSPVLLELKKPAMISSSIARPREPEPLTQ